MGLVNIVLNGRTFKLGCGDGEERHLLGLAEHLETHIERLRHDVGAVPDEQIYLMAGLMVCDELWDARDQMRHTEGRTEGPAQRPSGMSAGAPSSMPRPAAKPERRQNIEPSGSAGGKMPAKSPKALQRS